MARFLCALSILSLLSSAHAQNSAADFTIHSQVVASNPPRFGLNFNQCIGSVDITDNAWIVDGGFGSDDIRINYTATDNGSANTFIDTDLNSAGTDFFASLNSNGAFNGAQARVYRFSSSTGQWALVRTGVVQSMTAVSGSNNPADHTITFTTSGAATLAGDVIWLSKDGNFANPDLSQWVNYLDSRFTFFAASWNSEGEGSFTRNDSNACTYTHVNDVPSGQTNGTSAVAPLSVKITDSATGTAGIWQYMQGFGSTSDSSQVNEQFESGHTYTVSVWLKQQGIASGNATVLIGTTITHTFTGITNQWQQFTFSFPAPGTLNGTGYTIRLDYSAPGTLWVNQFRLSDSSHSPFTLDSRVLQAFQNYHPGVIRLWSCFSRTAGSYSFLSLDSQLEDESIARGDPSIGSAYYAYAAHQKLPAGLALCSQLGANPWIICNMSWSEQEWSNFIDYLAAPAGVGYASKRPSNHPGPYTSDFSKIYLEFGNEEWGTQQTEVNGQYGAWAHYMFSQAIAGKSYYDSTKIKLILNNFTGGDTFGFNALASCPESQALDYFLYTGSSATGDAGFQNDLLSIETYKGNLDAWTLNAQQSAAAGHPYEVTSYEGGPGSDNPNASGLGDDSLAAAVGQLDVYLYAQQDGATALNFFLYNLGIGLYTSHTNFVHGFVPHPIWEVLQMRNQYCAGDIVRTDTNIAPVVNDGTNTSLATVYAFHDTTTGSDRADIVVLSRDLNNSTPVTIHLPAVPTGGATLYTLTGNPRANNDNGTLTIPIGTQTISKFTQDYTFTLPPGSVYLFQVPTGAWAAAGPTNPTIQGGTSYNQLSWSGVAGATSYVIYRSTSPTNFSSTAYASGVSGTNFIDSGVNNGTTYYYKIAAVTPSGQTDLSSELSATPIAAGPFIAINSGGGNVSGTNWIADTDNDGGGFTQTEGTQVIPSSLVNPAPQAVYQTVRAGGTYTIPGLKPGSAYTVRIHGEEPYYTSGGHRLQDIILNGTTVESGLDWFTVAGGTNIAAIRSYPIVENASGSLTVHTQATPGSSDGNSEFSGIEVLTGAVPLAPTNLTAQPTASQVTLSWTAAPGADTYTVQYGTASGVYSQTVRGITGTSTTITGLAGGLNYYFVVLGSNADGLGHASAEVHVTLPSTAETLLQINSGGSAVAGTGWIADTDVSGGYAVASNDGQVSLAGVVNPAPQAVYQSAHYGGTYTIPNLVPGNIYRIRVHSEESYWNSAGERLENILINGVVVLNNFDMFAAAGGAHKAIVEEFMAQAQSNGTITLQVVAAPGSPDSNCYFCGIEVLTGTIAQIDCGGSAVAGTSWVADTNFNGGSGVLYNDGAVSVAGVVNPAPAIVYQSAHYGGSYTIPNLVAGGTYKIRLHSEECYWTSAGKRLENILINGLIVQSNFDMFAVAGGAHKAIVEEFTAQAQSNGTITIQVVAAPGSPDTNCYFCGIELLTGAVAQINCGGSAVSGTSWVADTDVSGGFAVASNDGPVTLAGVTNPAPQAVYQSAHYGGTYTIPNLVPGVTYLIRLHAEECYWTGSGHRLENILINGAIVLNNFDMFAAAGGAHKAIVEQFTAQAQNNGTITLQVVAAPGAPDTNCYFCGIEIIQNN